MAVTFTSSVTGGAQSSSLTLSSVDASGTDTLIVLEIAIRGAPATVTATFNTTENFTEQATDVVGNATVYLFTLLAPTSTTADVVISMSAGLRIAASASLYEGVDQTTPIRSGTIQTANGSSTAPAVSVTGTSGDLIVDSMSVVANGPPSVTATHTERVNITQTGGGADVGLGSQDLTATGGADSMAWTLGSSADWSIAALALIPAGGGAGISIPVVMNQLRNQGIA